MKEIGGYFELELNSGNEYHSDAIRLNLGRTAFEYVLMAKKVQRIFLPYYTCDVMLDPVKRVGVNYVFYQIDENLEPVFNYNTLNDADHFLYTNYFGVKNNFVDSIANRIKNLIVDNSQAFFSKPLPRVDSFYSPRKFFGVPDGGYLYTNVRLDCILEQDISWERLDHLVLRIDKSAEDGYRAFIQSNNSMRNQPVKTMSKLTQSLLQNIDYKKARDKRNDNFMFLHEKLCKKNEFNIDFTGMNAPMIYPLLCSNGKKVKTKLIENKIFVASYWKNEIIKNELRSYEEYLKNNMIPLPIDQRYGITELKTIIDLI